MALTPDGAKTAGISDAIGGKMANPKLWNNPHYQTAYETTKAGK